MNTATMQVDVLLGEAAKEAYAEKQILRVRFVDEFFALAVASWQGEESALPLASKAVRDFAAWLDDGVENGDFAPSPTVEPAVWKSLPKLQAVVGNGVDVRLVEKLLAYMEDLRDALGE